MKKTVAELIEELSQFDSTLEVRFAYNAGDYWRTQVAAPIRNIDEGLVVYSSYHSMEKTVDDEGDEGDDLKKVVLLF